MQRASTALNSRGVQTQLAGYNRFLAIASVSDGSSFEIESPGQINAVVERISYSDCVEQRSRQKYAFLYSITPVGGIMGSQSRKLCFYILTGSEADMILLDSIRLCPKSCSWDSKGAV